MAGKRLPREAEWEIAADSLEERARSGNGPPVPTAYPGYREPRGAVGEYNGKFMANQMVLRAGARPRPPDMCAAPIATSFRPTPDGCLVGSDSRRIFDERAASGD